MVPTENDGHLLPFLVTDTLRGRHQEAPHPERDVRLRHNLAHFLPHSANNRWEDLGKLRLDAGAEIQPVRGIIHGPNFVQLDTYFDDDLATGHVENSSDEGNVEFPGRFSLSISLLLGVFIGSRRANDVRPHGSCVLLLRDEFHENTFDSRSER